MCTLAIGTITYAQRQETEPTVNEIAPVSNETHEKVRQATFEEMKQAEIEDVRALQEKSQEMFRETAIEQEKPSL